MQPILPPGPATLPRHIIVVVTTLVVIAGIGVPAAPAGSGPPRAARPVPGTPCALLPHDNIWNTEVDDLPVHDSSETWLDSMHANETDLHPDFGPPDYGIPYRVVDRDTPRRAVRFTYASESDRKRYPITKGTPIEAGSDRHALMVDRERCVLYELYRVRWRGKKVTAGSGAIFRLGSNALRPDGWTSADAAGLPILPGLVRYDEVEAGEIDHAIRMTAEVTTDGYVWPARHEAGVDDPDAPPMGARFRLDADYDISGFGERAQIVLRAMQAYGMIVADNGSDWYFTGTRDKRWTNGLLDQLKQVPAGAFEAVDTSDCIVDADSGAAECPPEA
ncbi:MAG: hypothetical protein WD206_03975 [Actinomycetota bacterium]